MSGMDFSRRRVLVVGDVMLDRTLIGQQTRRAPESGAPVLDISRERMHAGGAANVAANVCSLGGECVLVGAIGNDDAAKDLRGILLQAGVVLDWIVVADRPTTTKLRIETPQSPLLRCDRECREPLVGEFSDELWNRCRAHLNDIDVILISDYAKGVCTAELCRRLIGHPGRRVIVDSKVGNWDAFAGAYLLLPNLQECSVLLGQPCPDDPRDIHANMEPVRQRYDIGSVVVTRGASGLTILGNHAPLSIPAFSTAPIDVTGAGDTIGARRNRGSGKQTRSCAPYDPLT